MDELSFAVAFLAGIVSFLSPCILPIIPGFLSYLAGTSIGKATAKRHEIFFVSVFFVLGFSFVFAALGVLLNTLLEAIAYDVQLWLSRIGGAVIIFFGLYLMRLLRISFLERPHALAVKTSFRSRYLTAFVFGAAFAAGWTPCVGAVLGGVLGLAASAPGSAFALLLAYGAGLGLPFLVVGFFTAQASRFIARYARAFEYVSIAFGALLIVLGVLVFTQNLNRIANLEFLNRLLLSN